MLILEERGKPENREKNLSEQRKEPTTNLTLIIMAVSPPIEPQREWASGRRVQSPLSHPCSLGGTQMSANNDTTLAT